MSRPVLGDSLLIFSESSFILPKRRVQAFFELGSGPLNRLVLWKAVKKRHEEDVFHLVLFGRSRIRHASSSDLQFR